MGASKIVLFRNLAFFAVFVFGTLDFVPHAAYAAGISGDPCGADADCETNLCIGGVCKTGCAIMPVDGCGCYSTADCPPGKTCGAIAGPGQQGQCSGGPVTSPTPEMPAGLIGAFVLAAGALWYGLRRRKTLAQ